MPGEHHVNALSEVTVRGRTVHVGVLLRIVEPGRRVVNDPYRDLTALKESLLAYRQARDERERELFYESIREQASALHLEVAQG